MDYFYYPTQAEMRVDLRHQNGGTSLLFRGIDVMRMAMWLRDHTRSIRAGD